VQAAASGIATRLNFSTSTTAFGSRLLARALLALTGWRVSGSPRRHSE
jgi:hypothetical protein